MKMTRSKLKGIVKECLVEILSEGISTKNSEISSLDSSPVDKKSQRQFIKEEKLRLENHRKNLDKKIQSTVSNLTSDSVMQDILADTARTTLQEQMNHDSRPGSPGGAGPGIDLDDIFLKSANNWSDLAFNDKKRT